MKILLLGEYSNVHWTLAEGLRSLGHEVCVVSNGDYWKNYKTIELTKEMLRNIPAMLRIDSRERSINNKRNFMAAKLNQ